MLNTPESNIRIRQTTTEVFIGTPSQSFSRNCYFWVKDLLACGFRQRSCVADVTLGVMGKS